MTSVVFSPAEKPTLFSRKWSVSALLPDDCTLQGFVRFPVSAQHSVVKTTSSRRRRGHHSFGTGKGQAMRCNRATADETAGAGTSSSRDPLWWPPPDPE
eukprot:5186834-Pyramimonas_sp.AAC.1